MIQDLAIGAVVFLCLWLWARSKQRRADDVQALIDRQRDHQRPLMRDA